MSMIIIPNYGTIKTIEDNSSYLFYLNKLKITLYLSV